MAAHYSIGLGVADMNAEEQFDEALRSAQPMWRLREVVQSMLAEGQERDAVYAARERFRTLLQKAGRDADEDVVLEVMDCLTSWCSPHMRL
jgi:hypothetical protein